jgi:TrmH family RNA methyltransferase
MGRHEVLTSPANPLLKDVRRAIARGGLTEQGWFIADTPHLLEEALRSGLEVQVVLAAESASRPVRDLVKGPRLAIVEDALFQKLSDTASSQNVIALVTPPSWTLEQMLGARSLVIALDGVQDPGNAGAIVRVAEAFGASGAIFLKGTVSPFNTKTLRASAGSLFRLPFVHSLDAAAARAALEPAGMTFYAAMPHAAAPLAEADLTRSSVIVIGAEGGGVSEPMRRGAIGLSIPTAGVESLNAAVAAGIILYEARRQRDLQT